MQPHTALAKLSAACEDFVHALELHPLPLPPHLSHHSGEIRGQRVELRTQCYASEEVDRLVIARMFNADSALISVTLALTPANASPAPILGLDYVTFSGSLSLVALDLCPLDREFWEQHCDGVMQDLHATARDRLVLRRAPEFTHETFSELAILAAARPGANGVAVELAQRLLDAYIELLAAARAAPPYPAARDGIARWRTAMRRNKKESSSLSRIFGESFTTTYLHDALFPVT